MNTVPDCPPRRVRRVTALRRLLAAVSLAGFFVCAPWCVAQQRPSLKDAFADDFLVGAAMTIEQVDGREPGVAELVAQQFNSITSELLFKWIRIHPEPGKYIFDDADQFVDFGERNGMIIVGHTLVWDADVPPWVFQDEAGNDVDRETLLARMREHIHTLVGRYKGRVDGWDVVNEAFNDDGTLTETPWQRIIGDDYIEKAFQYAHEADPAAELYYNDYNEWFPAKRAAFKKLVGDLRAKGLRIDGLGLQGHWVLDYPDLEDVEAMFNDLGTLDVKLMITEMDMDLLPSVDPSLYGKDISEVDPALKLDPYVDGLPDEIEKQQADRYAAVFACLHRHQDKIARVTFWGVHDGQSWLNFWLLGGRTNYPLLIDRQLQPKPAFDAVIGTVEQP
jgi:endo-1,4-beta-xylanase